MINRAYRSQFRAGGIAALATLLAMLWASTASASLLGIEAANGAPPDITIICLQMEYDPGINGDPGTLEMKGVGWSLNTNGQQGSGGAWYSPGFTPVSMLDALVDQNGVLQSGSTFAIPNGTGGTLLGGTLQQFGYANSPGGNGVTLQFVADSLHGDLATQFHGTAGINILINDYRIPSNGWVSGFTYTGWTATTDVFPVVPEPSSLLAWSLGLASVCVYRRWSRRPAT